MSAIELRAVDKRFGRIQVLRSIDLTVPAHSLTAVLGASGSGKTTLLRLIAGFEQLDGGSISIADRLLDDGRRSVRSRERGVGYVPQDGALFPHLSVIGNVGFGLQRKRRSRALELIELVGLSGLEHRHPHQLSGGQQQRVALARALATQPRVVLLDEPFSSLDASLRGALSRDVARILAELGTTAVLVTHDQSEALALADRIAVLERGRLVACDDPRNLYDRPVDIATARSLGEVNLLRGTVGGELATCALGEIRCETIGRRFDGPALLLLRPEQLRLHREPVAGAAIGTLSEIRYHGHDALASVRLDRDTAVLARVPGNTRLRQGARVWLEPSEPARSWPAGADEPRATGEPSTR